MDGAVSTVASKVTPLRVTQAILQRSEDVKSTMEREAQSCRGHGYLQGQDHGR